MDDNIEARIVALTDRVEKAAAHYPAGTPGGRGGQFAPGTGSASHVTGLIGSTATHFTSEARADSLIAGTHDFGQSSGRTWQGAGVYLFPGDHPGGTDFGAVKLTVHHALKTPFIGSTQEIERKVDELKATLTVPAFRTPDGKTVAGHDGKPLQIWASDQQRNAALREAWLKAGHDGLVEVDRASGKPLTVAIFDPRSLGKVERAIAKAAGKPPSFFARWPAGTPGGKGGEFASGGTKGGAGGKGGGGKGDHLQAAGLKANSDGTHSVVHTNAPLAGLHARQALNAKGWKQDSMSRQTDGSYQFGMSHAEHGKMTFTQRTRDRQPPDRNGKKMPAVPITLLIAR